MKITFSILWKLKKLAIVSLAKNKYLFDSNALEWLARPGFPPMLVK